MIGNESRSATFWDKRAATYDKTEAENQELHKTIVERSLEYVGSQDVTLDFGCGTGALSYALAPHVKELHGVDISQRMIETARDRADGNNVEGLRFSAASIFDDAFEPDSYDAIVASQVLHVLSHDYEALQRIHRLVKPGGWFLSTTPCMNDGKRVMKLVNGALSLAGAVQIVPGLKFYSAPDLDRLISDAGFEIHETTDLPFDQRSDMRYVFARFVAARKIR